MRPSSLLITIAIVFLVALATAATIVSRDGDKPVGPDSSELSARSTMDETTTTPDAPKRGRLKLARCPTNETGCEEASGTVWYLERVDADGDGDLHVIIDEHLTVIKVPVGLRPKRDPKRGDRVSAAGQIVQGSSGADQILAEEFHVARQ